MLAPIDWHLVRPFVDSSKLDPALMSASRRLSLGTRQLFSRQPPSELDMRSRLNGVSPFEPPVSLELLQLTW